jgi:hypothetical protein
MNSTYLSQEKIKALKHYLNDKLPTKARTTLLQIRLKTGLELYYNTVENQKLFWQWCNDKLKTDIQDPLYAEFVSNLNSHEIFKAGDILKVYIERHYKNEWQFVNSFDATQIDIFLNGYGVIGFFKENGVNPISIKEIIECPNIDELIEQNYSKKNCDPALLKRTETIKTTIDTLCQDIDVRLLQNAIGIYWQNKNTDELHNLLNKI